MPTLSVAMIVKNEEEHLPQCLETVKGWVDEIVILDSGSTDRTQEIALEYGAKFYENTDWQGFGKQRQMAQNYVTSDYVLWIDADERITPELKQSIQQAVENNKPNTLYRVNRLSEVFGRQIKHSGWHPDWVVRLYPTDLAQYEDRQVHEKVDVPKKAKVKKLKGKMLHYTYKDLHHYLAKSADYISTWADDKAKAGKKSSLFKACLHGFTCFMKMYIFRLGFLDGKQGFLLAMLSSYSTFTKYADLWIKTKDKK